MFTIPATAGAGFTHLGCTDGDRRHIGEVEVADTSFGTRTHGLRARLARHVQLREVAFAVVLTGAADFAAVSEAVCMVVDDVALFPMCILVCPCSTLNNFTRAVAGFKRIAICRPRQVATFVAAASGGTNPSGA